MPFVRFARDKRGYEYVYLVHDSTRGGRSSRPVVLYWYRTPPGVKVGRPPFDEEVRQRLEAQNPDIRFDWRAITSAQPPPPDAEHWRERRRVEKAAKLARLKEERADAEPDANEREDAASGEEIAKTEEGRVDELAAGPAPEPAAADEAAPPAAGESGAEENGAAAVGGQPPRSRRRRRGRRRKHRPGGSEERQAAPSKAPRDAPAAPASPDRAEAGDAAESAPQEREDS